MRADHFACLSSRLGLLAVCVALTACGSMPTPDAQLGQTVRQGMQQQRIAPALPPAADADQTTAREMREGLSNHMTGKGSAPSALQAPMSGGRTSQ